MMTRAAVTVAVLIAIAAPVTAETTATADLPHILDIAAAIANAVPGSRRVSLAGAGHMLNLDDPAGVDAALRSFLTP